MKDAYYFSHDSNAQGDPKCVALIDQMGMEGYGIFWALVERLRNEPEAKLPMYILPGLARGWNTSKEKIEAVVKCYDLFKISDDSFFFSESLCRRLKLFNDKKKSLSDAGKRGNAIRWRSGGDRVAIGSQSQRKVKESKVKESKVKDTPIPPEGDTTTTHPLIEWVMKNAPRVQKMEEPLTAKEAEDIVSSFPKEKIKNVLGAMHNYKLLLKKNVSANKTLRNWLARDGVTGKGEEPININPKDYLPPPTNLSHY